MPIDRSLRELTDKKTRDTRRSKEEAEPLTHTLTHTDTQTHSNYLIMAIRVKAEGSSDIGVFALLTNKYCLVGLGSSENFYR